MNNKLNFNKQNQDYFLSIIIPVYNIAGVINKCLNSLIPQLRKHEDVVIYLVDDGSTDDSWEIINKYSQKNVITIKKDNGGVSSARNAGLDNCSSRFVTFIDGDDYVADNYLDILKDKIYYEDQLVVFNFTYDYISKVKEHNVLTDEIVELKINDGINKFLDISFYDKYFSSVWNKIFRVDLINKINLRFNTNKHIGEDEFFCVEYFENIKKVRSISDNLYFYVQRDDSALHKYNSNKVKECQDYILIYQQLSKLYSNQLDMHSLISYYLRMLFGLINNESKSPTFLVGYNNVHDFVYFDYFQKNRSNIIVSRLSTKLKIYYVLIQTHLYLLVYTVLYLKNKLMNRRLK